MSHNRAPATPIGDAALHYVLAEDAVNVAACLVALTTDLYSIPTPDSFIPQQAVKRIKQALHSILLSLCLFSAS